MNESLLLVNGIVSTFFVYVAWKIGEERLYTAIVVFLILIATTGGKLVEFLGHETNAGNIFYASVFLATYFFLERYGKAGGIRTLWLSVIIVASYAGLVQLAILYEGAASTAALNDALDVVFGDSIRVTVASIFAYIVSQFANIHLFCYLKKRMQQHNVWLRANISNVFAQIIDSAIFFPIAFFGINVTNIWDIIITGLFIKIVYMVCAAPLLYLNRLEFEEQKEFNSIRLR